MPPGSKFSKRQYENLAAFRYGVRQFLRFSEDAARRAGVTAQQHQALLAIKGFPGRDTVTVGELAKRLQVRPHTTVELVNRLMKLKLAIRERSVADRRQVLVRLTPQGEEILEGLSSVHQEQLRRIGPRLRTLLAQLGSAEAAERRR